MNTQLAIRIQASGKRKRWVKTMLGMLENDPRIVVVEDEKHDLWESAKKTLEAHKPYHKWMLVLQDDVLPCRDLIATAERLIELLPDKPITLFSNKDIILHAKAQGKHWCLLSKWLMGQCYLVPTPIIEDFLAWADRHIKPEIYFDDSRWGMYCHYKQIPVYATVPSLAQHLFWDSTTLRGGYRTGHTFDPKQRMAKDFIGFEQSGMNIDWEKDLEKPVKDTEKIIGDWTQYYIE